MDLRGSPSTITIHDSAATATSATTPDAQGPVAAQPSTAHAGLPFELEVDEYGFVDGAGSVDGIYAAGCVKHPCDVARATKESTAAALQAIQCLNRG